MTEADLDRRIAAFIAGPAGCAFLLIVEEAGIAPAVAARPEVAVHVAAVALAAIDRWRSDHPWAPTTALSQGPRLAGLARAILAQPEPAVWSAPLDRAAQVWISSGTFAPPRPGLPSTPTVPLAAWQAAAAWRDGPRLLTSTAVGDTTSILAGIEHGADDLHVDGWPIDSYHLSVPDDARVLEIDGPETWRELCLRYPGEVTAERQLDPDWAAVRRDWNGVHVGLWAILIGEQVRLETPGGWTEIDPIEAEHAVWLRWGFDAVVHQESLSAAPPSPIPHGPPHALVDWDRDDGRWWVVTEPGEPRAPPRPPAVRLRAAAGGNDGPGQDGTLVWVNWAIEGERVTTTEEESLAWPSPLPIAGSTVVVDLGTPLMPLMVEVWQRQQVAGVRQSPVPTDNVRCVLDPHEGRCRLRQGEHGHWQVVVDLDGWPTEVLPTLWASWPSPVFAEEPFDARWRFAVRLPPGPVGS